MSNFQFLLHFWSHRTCKTCTIHAIHVLIHWHIMAGILKLKSHVLTFPVHVWWMWVSTSASESGFPGGFFVLVVASLLMRVSKMWSILLVDISKSALGAFTTRSYPGNPRSSQWPSSLQKFWEFNCRCARVPGSGSSGRALLSERPLNGNCGDCSHCPSGSQFLTWVCIPQGPCVGQAAHVKVWSLH